MLQKKNICSKEGERCRTEEKRDYRRSCIYWQTQQNMMWRVHPAVLHEEGRRDFWEIPAQQGSVTALASDGRCISLLKVLQTNHCIYDCKYCLNRASNDVERTAFTPEELCSLTIEFYKRNYIEGLFLSSGVDRSPAYTMEQMCRTLRLLRSQYHFRGYIHVKAVPGAPEGASDRSRISG